jgi:hypothetical protein
LKIFKICVHSKNRILSFLRRQESSSAAGLEIPAYAGMTLFRVDLYI